MRSLTGDQTLDLPHSKPVGYRGGGAHQLICNIQIHVQMFYQHNKMTFNSNIQLLNCALKCLSPLNIEQFYKKVGFH